jgi:hypothetical protein
MSQEQRGTRRFPVPPGHEQGVLRVGRVDVDVRISDTSATGFLLVCPALTLEKGQFLHLLSWAGWSEVRVAFFEGDSDGCRVGVERVRDLPIDSDCQTAWWRYLFSPHHPIAGAGGLVLMGSLLAVLLVVAISLISDIWPPARPYDVFPHVSRLATYISDACRPIRDSAKVPLGQLVARPATASHPAENRPTPNPRVVIPQAASTQKATASGFIAFWRSDKQAEAAARLRLSRSQVLQINAMLQQSSPNDSPGQINQRLAAILTAEQMRAIESEF